MAHAGATMKPQPETKLTMKPSMFSRVRWEHLVAGMAGGVVSTLALHPLDLIKIRFQVNEGVALSPNRPQYSGIINAFTTIGRTQGLKGLYQGVTPNVWGAGASWGLYFLFYNSLKSWSLDRQSVTTLSAGQHMLVASQAGVLTLVLTNPVWVAKTRLCLQYDSVAPPVAGAKTTPVVVYKGMADCLLKIYRLEGVRGLYKGFVPGMFGVSHGALQFMAYEELKKMYNKYRNVPLDTRFNTSEYLCFAALSKIFAAGTTYPYQVVRARLQDQHCQYTGIVDVVQKIWRREGGRGFYKGIVPGLLRVTPACCITFVVYESMTSYLMGENKPGQKYTVIETVKPQAETQVKPKAETHVKTAVETETKTENSVSS